MAADEKGEPAGELVEQRRAAGVAESLIDDRGEVEFDDAGNPIEPEADDAGQADDEGRAEFVALLEKLLEVGFSMLASRRGKTWLLKPGEARALAEPAVDVLDKYDLTPETCEGRLVFAALSVVGPRIMLERSERARVVEPEPADGGEGL